MSELASACQGEQADGLAVDISSNENRSGFTEDDIVAFFVAWRKRTYRKKSIANRDDVAQLIVALISDAPALKRVRSAPDLKGMSFGGQTVVRLDPEDDSDDDLESSYTSAEEISVLTGESEPELTRDGGCPMTAIAVCLSRANVDDSHRLELTSTGEQHSDKTSERPMHIACTKDVHCEAASTRDSALATPKTETSQTSPAPISPRCRYRELRSSCVSPTPTGSSSDVCRHSMIDLFEIDRRLLKEQYYRQARPHGPIQQLSGKGKAAWSPLASDAGSMFSWPSMQVPDSDDIPLSELRALLQQQHQPRSLLQRPSPSLTSDTTAEAIPKSGQPVQRSQHERESTFDAAQAAHMRAQWLQQLNGGGDRAQRLPLIEDQIRQEMIVEHRNAKLRALREAQQRQARQSIEHALLRTPYMEDLRRQAMRKMQIDANNRYEIARAELMAENARLQAEEGRKQEEKMRRIESALGRMHVKVSLSRFRNM